MKIVFMGTPDFATQSLKKLVEENYDVVLVVSQPDKPKGRGMHLVPTPVKEYALSQNIEVVQPEKIRGDINFINKLKEVDADIFVVVAYGKILPKEVLELPKYGAINVHGSLLPKYRGAAPIQRSIMNGEEVTGITTMYLDEGMDTGDMLLKKEVTIEVDDTYETLHDKLKIIGADLLIDTIKEIEAGTIKREKQDETIATVAPMIEKPECKLDFSKTSKEIYDLIRGVYPFPCSFAELDDGRVFKIHKAEIEDDIDVSDISSGEVIASDPKNGLIVKCSDSAIRLSEIQERNSKRITDIEYIRGKKIEVGQKFVK